MIHGQSNPLTSRLANRLAVLPLAALATSIATVVAVSPSKRPLKAVLALAGLWVAMAASPQAFIAGSVFVFAVSSAMRSAVLPSLPVPVYLTDFMVLLIALRGALPRERVPGRKWLSGPPTWLFGAWCFVMALAALRAMQFGVPLNSALRGDIAVIYWPLLYFGYTRVLRERNLDTSALWRDLAIVTLGLTAWMFVARVINHPFHDNGLGLVATGSDTAVRRNFGFATAFIVYPLIALVGIAGMAYTRHQRPRWLGLAAVGTIATLTTLVRGEIFGLAVGALAILWLRPMKAETSARVRTAVQLAFALAIVIVGLLATSPTLARAIVQRAIPLVHQSRGATLNKDYREKAVTTGFHVANAHPAGLGVLDVHRLAAENIDRGFLAHSGVATLLLFGGWPALIFAVLAVVAVLHRSARSSAAMPWFHPALVGVLVMLSVYAVTAASLAGDPWVIPLGPLAIALRFTLPPPQAAVGASTGA